MATFDRKTNFDAQHAAGLLGALKGLTSIAPQAGLLLQGLSAGAVNSQQVEAKRLAAKHGDGDARVQAAQLRAKALAALADDVAVGVAHVGNLLQTATQDNLFHGYVLDADGKPVAAQTVELTVPRWVEQHRAPLTGKTDGDGYFRIWLGASSGQSSNTGQGAGTSGPVSHLDLLRGFAARFAKDSDAAKASEVKAAEVKASGVKADIQKEAANVRLALNTGNQPTTASTTNPVPTPVPSPTPGPAPSPGDNKDLLDSRVRIFNPGGQLVYEDSLPPQFEVNGDTVESQFRYYALVD
ncbi:hypothetical protein SAMN02745857_00765 [Andreprevotia lacus DSM 23236]|jgi:hypothetical protein|uniref:Uncharacterized protein n=1 Tax=Andreprevotia lacus DSM 23236 TaxID=1121001 RepID=A0A1W1X6T6_9NEIS|nr:hypothetical protein [Andreprevotia lacus]SMC19679.1 hypothetical protein SAMN02745857_00765 [Andreprevotia lacus DSM 23236]